jgi:hypothetical protein
MRESSHHFFLRTRYTAIAQSIPFWEGLANHAHRVDEFYGVNLLENLAVDLYLVSRRKSFQEIDRRRIPIPVLVIDYVHQPLKKFDGGSRVEQPSLEFSPVAAMEVFGHVNAAIGEGGEVP